MKIKKKGLSGIAFIILFLAQTINLFALGPYSANFDAWVNSGGFFTSTFQSYIYSNSGNGVNEDFFRFPLNIPAGSVVVDASIAFYVYANHNGHPVNFVGTPSYIDNTLNWSNKPTNRTTFYSFNASTSGTWYTAHNAAFTNYVSSQFTSGYNYLTVIVTSSPYNPNDGLAENGYVQSRNSSNVPYYYVTLALNFTINASAVGFGSLSGVPISASNDYNNNGNGISPFNRVYTDSTNFTLTAPTSYSSGGITYNFLKWQKNGADFGGNTSAGLTFNETSGSTITAVYQKLWVVTANAGANGSIAPSGVISVVNGNNQTFNFTPNAHYQVASILVDGSNIGTTPNTYPFNNVIANHTITVNFSNIPRTVTANIYGPGTISSQNTTIYREFFDSPVYTFSSNSNAYVVGSVLINGVATTNISPKTFSQISQDYVLDVFVVPRNGSDPLFFGTEF